MKTENLIRRRFTALKFALILVFSTPLSFLHAQAYHAIQSDITVTGKYNTGMWKMTTQTAKCTAELGIKENNLESVKSLTLSIAVKDLKGHASLMNKRAHKALKAYPYENITYTGKLSRLSALGNNKYLLTTEGNLNIAGTTRVVSIPVTMVLNNDGTITATGSTNIKMSNFNVRLPRVLVEEMTIENTVLVSFKLELAKL